MNKSHDAIIFDCDGTLADTMPVHYMAWLSTLERYGIPFAEDRFYGMGGWATQKIVATLAAETGVALDAAKVAHEKELAFHERMTRVEPIEPVVKVARENRGKLPMGVATGSPRWSAQRTLSMIGVLDWFGAIVTADDVIRHKPDPDVFLEAARRLGVKPERCLVYEDAEPGIVAATRAGMKVIDVRAFFTPRRVTAV